MSIVPSVRSRAVILLLAISVAGVPSAGRGSDAEQVDAFLARLGLVELQILHLEQQLDADPPAPDRVRLGQHLADLYAARLLDTQENADEYNGLLQRIDALVKRVPEANTPALAVMLLQADFSRAERLVGQWMADPRQTASRDAAVEIFSRIAPQLKQHQTQLTAKTEALAKELDDQEEDPQRDAKFRDFRQLQAVAGRAAYFSGWAHYYLGLITSDQAALTVARDTLRKLLDIGEQEKYADIDVEWLNLDSVYRSWAVIGLGVTEAALGNLNNCRDCFRLLEAPGVPLEVRDQTAYWYLQGLINAGHLAEAKAIAEKQTATFNGDATQGKVSFCVALVRAGFARPAVSAESRELGELGLVGLVKLGQPALAQKLMEEYGIQVDAGAGFFLQWLKGRQLFAHAEDTKQAEDYEAAARQLTAALEDREVRSHPALAGLARYELAWCAYRQEDYPTAAREFEQAIDGLKADQSDTAAESAWAAVHCYREAGAVNSAIAVLERIMQDFPGHKYARQAPFLINKLKETEVPPSDLIERLNRIQPDDPTYATARFEICSLLRRVWSEAAAGDKADAARKLREAVDGYLPLEEDVGAAPRKLKACLMVAETALAAQPPDQAVAAAYLEQARPLAESLPPSTSAVTEYHYRRMQLATAAGDAAATAEHSRWLVENAAGSAYELSAIVNQARAIEQTAKAATGEELQKANREGFAVFSRLVALVGDSRESLSTEKNARVASSRLAHYAYEVGDYREAARRLERLLEVFPTDAGYLQRAMRAHFRAGNFTDALDRARTLLEGNRSGSTPWYEAKYYQLNCLLRTDPPAARRVWEQFQLLHPNMGGDEWRQRFEEVGRGIVR